MDRYCKTVIWGLSILVLIPFLMYGMQYVFNLEPYQVVFITLGSGALAIVLRFYIPWKSLKQQNSTKV